MLNKFFFDLDYDIISHLISVKIPENTLIIFNDENSKKLAWSLFQPVWDFSDIKFVSHAEFKRLTQNINLPLMEDIKRYLFFYLSMTEDIRKKYECHDYFVSVEFLNNVFDLMEELQENLITPNNLVSLIKDESNLKDWQIDYWNDILNSVSNYETCINKMGFTDKIFLSEQNIDIEILYNYDHILWINPINISKFDRLLLDKLSENKTVNLYYNLPEELFDKTNHTLLNLKIQDIFNVDSLKEKLRVFQSKNSFGMIRQLVECCSTNEQLKTIIDIESEKEYLFQSLNQDYFKILNYQPVTHTPLYKFLNNLYSLVNELIFDYKKQMFLLPLKPLFHYLTHTEFYSLINISDINIDIADLNLFFSKLDKESFLYVDMNGFFLNLIKPDAYNQDISQVIKALIRIINKLTEIKTVSELIALLNDNTYFNLQNIFYLEDESESQILDVWLESIANLKSLDELEVFTQANILFNPDKPVGIYLLSFIVEFVRGRKIKVNSKALIDIINLEDSLNLQYQQIALLNFIEGKIPAPKQIPFLFTDQQRKSIGLSSHIEKRSYVKYLFFKQLCQAEKAYIFTISNSDENVQRSSFLEEIILLVKPLIIQLEDTGYLSFYQNRYLTNYRIIPDQTLKLNPVFFNIPFKDIIDKVHQPLKISYYSWNMLSKNPYLWFIHLYTNLENLPLMQELSLDPKRLGIFIHEIIGDYINSFGISQPVEKDEFIKIIKNKIKCNLTDYKAWYLKFPQNYDGLYFIEFLQDQLIENLYQLLSSDIFLPSKSLGSQSYTEKDFKVDFCLNVNENSFNARVTGRFDLLIKEGNNIRIIDFKTGMGNNQQLKFYQMLYNFSNVSDNGYQLYACLINIINMKKTDLKTRFIDSENDLDEDQKLLHLIQNILEDTILNGCYATNKNLIDPLDLDIVRLDALRKKEDR